MKMKDFHGCYLAKHKTSGNGQVIKKEKETVSQ